MLAGGFVGAFWITLNTPVSAALPGFAAGLIIIFVVSYVTKPL
jgi:hypothetical protein